MGARSTASPPVRESLLGASRLSAEDPAVPVGLPHDLADLAHPALRAGQHAVLM